jgi:hypothetical protein
MDTLKPSEDVIKAFRENFEECWREAVANVNKNTAVNADVIALLDAEIENYTNLAGAAKSEVVVARYEQKIEALDKKLKSLKQKSLISIDLTIPYRTALDKVMETAKDPYKTWDSSDLPGKKKLFYFFFDGNILYDVKTGYRTENPSVLYRFFQDFGKKSGDVDMVRNLSNQFNDLLNFIKRWSINEP